MSATSQPSIPIVDVSSLTALCRDARFYRINASHRYRRSDLGPVRDAIVEHLYEPIDTKAAVGEAAKGGSDPLFIDPARYRLRPAAAKAAAALYGALHNVGFSYISHHSVDLSLQRTIDDLSRDFFGGRGLEEKMGMAMPKGGKAWRGYFPVGGELTSGKPDIKEGIYFGQKIYMKDTKVEIEGDDKNKKVVLMPRDNRAADPLYGDSLYPTDAPSGPHPATATAESAKRNFANNSTTTKWPAAIDPYMQQCEALGQAMMCLLAIALELEHGPLAFIANGVCDDPLGLFRIFHYPPPATLKDPKLRDEAALWGVGEHTDYGLLTLLKQDDVGGLQVRHRNGQWIAAPPVEGTLVVNVGDMLEAITSGLLLSTPHRVRNPDPSKMRISFPYFFDPCVDFVIRPLKLSPKMARAAAESVEARRAMGWGRWDSGAGRASVDVASMIGGEKGLTYGTYLTRKVTKVFPMLAQSHL